MFGFGKKIDADQITKELHDGQALLIDVRGSGEWNSGHAQGALHLPVDQILRGELPTEARSKKLYLYCGSGGRASMAGSYLRQKGFDVENIGGIGAWQNGGGKVDAQ